ncbi:MAG TPA: PQQ-dependent sugar dehydrogenase [Bacteroidia bacterium]|jgi:glucose/arabinose dehydrogenase|nr:PQQ-dependent sugar dehydrogenase [Bacteroidia bacterium]
MKKTLLFAFVLCFPFLVNAQTYVTTNICTGLQQPVAFDFTPDNANIYLTLKGDGSTPSAPGSAVIKKYTIGGTFVSNFYDLSDSVDSYFECGLLGIACDPDYLTNKYIYCYYVHFLNNSERIRIIRLTDVADAGTNPQVILDIDITSYNIAGNHLGGNVHFRPSDPSHIYFTIGDLAYNQTSSGNYASMLNKPFGKTLRIGKDPVPAGSDVHAVGAFSCNVPTDNPFYDDGNPLTGNCDIIWTYGHRNPFDFCFNPNNDSMYNSENGLNTWDEMNMIHRGAYYGWNTCEGNFMNSSTTVPCNLTGDVRPIETWGAPLPAVTGILFYTSSVMPEFTNHLLVADNDYARIYDITLSNGPVYDQFVSRNTWQDLAGGLTTLKQGPEGCVYAMKGGYTTSGLIYKICPSGLGTEEFENQYFTLQQNVPNPFSTTSVIHYNVKQNCDIKISVYDMFGKEVAVLANGEAVAGMHDLTVNADDLGLANGNYCVVMQGPDAAQTIKISVVK